MEQLHNNILLLDTIILYVSLNMEQAHGRLHNLLLLYSSRSDIKFVFMYTIEISVELFRAQIDISERS